MRRQVEPKHRHAVHDAGDIEIRQGEVGAGQDLRLLREMTLEDSVDRLVNLGVPAGDAGLVDLLGAAPALRA